MVEVGSKVYLAVQDFPPLLEVIRRQGYRLVGPTLREGDLVYGDLQSAADLPRGWTDVQQGGGFRLEKRPDQALFGYGVGQQSWKQFLFPPRITLWQAQKSEAGWLPVPAEEDTRPLAFIGVHACDLAAMAVQDRTLLDGPYRDPLYARRRGDLLVVAVQCAGRTCATGFCASMGAGPQAYSGFDLALTEVVGAGEHFFMVEVGTARGADLLSQVPQRPAAPAETDQAAALMKETAGRMGRDLDTAGLKELLYRNYEHPRWDEVAARCLTCGNCTLVCPTCFCHTLEDGSDLTGTQAERHRRWDVCFSVPHSYLHGGSIRATPRSRYRQWLTHKLATWIDQFGCSGCVGCGRCITWCPVAIDITEEVRAIRETETKVE